MASSGLRGTVPTPRGPIRVAVSPLKSSCASIELCVPSSGVASVTLRLTAVLLSRLGVISDAPYFSSAASADSLNAAGLIIEHVSGNSVPTQLSFTLVQRDDAPLVNESCVACGRAASIEVELPSTVSAVHVCSAALPTPLVPTVPQPGPFPPQVWPGRFLGADYETQGTWVGRYGADGFVLFGFDQPSAAGADPFCGAAVEGGSVELQVCARRARLFCRISRCSTSGSFSQCEDSGASISSIRFASFGTPSGTCPSFVDGSCSANASLAVVEAACIGKQSCTIDVNNGVFGGDPCPGTSKQLFVVAHCNRGGGFQPNAVLPPADRSKLPPYVTSVTLQTPDLGGFCGARLSWTNGTSDARALQVRATQCVWGDGRGLYCGPPLPAQDPAGPGSLPRHLGLAQPCGCPTAPVDILLSDAAKAANASFRLSLYFVVCPVWGRVAVSHILHAFLLGYHVRCCRTGRRRPPARASTAPPAAKRSTCSRAILTCPQPLSEASPPLYLST